MEPPIVDIHTLEGCARVDVAYEMEQFCNCAMNSPALYPNAEIDGLLRQACFEGAVLHLRNLVEFLEKARPTSPSFASDLVADHYFDDGWTAKPDELLLYDASSKERNDDVRRNLHRHLAHITTTRHTLRNAGSEFQWSEIEPTLMLDMFCQFVSDLRSAHPDRADWFEHPRRTAAATAYSMRLAETLASSSASQSNDGNAPGPSAGDDCCPRAESL